MAAYPTLAISTASRRIPRGGQRIDLAEDGTPRARTLFSAAVYDMTLVHLGLSSTDRDSILSHYATEVNNAFSFTWPDGSIAHTVFYAQAPEVEYTPGGWNVVVQLVGKVT